MDSKAMTKEDDIIAKSLDEAFEELRQVRPRSRHLGEVWDPVVRKKMAVNKKHMGGGGLEKKLAASEKRKKAAASEKRKKQKGRARKKARVVA